MSTVSDIKARLAAGTTAKAVVESSLKAAEELQSDLNAFLQIDRDGAVKVAQAIDDTNDKAQLSLAGVPVAIKDNLCVRGMQTSCGSRILGDYHPPYNATVIRSVLRSAGR